MLLNDLPAEQHKAAQSLTESAAPYLVKGTKAGCCASWRRRSQIADKVNNPAAHRTSRQYDDCESNASST
jgi:hypothetical protein